MKLRAALLGALLVTMGVTCGCVLFGEEREIARRLNELAETASVDVDENPVIRMANAARVGRYFTEDGLIERGENAAPIQGRGAVVALAAQARTAVEDLRIRFTDVEIRVSGSDTAVAHLTLVVSGRGEEKPSTGSSIDARELRLTFRKIDGDWLIARVESLETLERPE